MKSSVATLLSLVATSAAQIFCIQAITTTVPYLPALTLAANNSCPTASSAKYYSVDGAAGCCSDAATAVTLQSTAGLACCPCAAQCTGYMPKIQAWTLIDDKLQITGPASLTAMATSAPTAITTAPITSNQPNGTFSLTSPSTPAPSATPTGTSGNPTSSSGATSGQGKVQGLFLGLGIFMGALWFV